MGQTINFNTTHDQNLQHVTHDNEPSDDESNERIIGNKRLNLQSERPTIECLCCSNEERIKQTDDENKNVYVT